MMARQIKLLVIVVILLLAGIVVMTMSDRPGDSTTGGLLFPGLKAEINNITQVSVSKAGESFTLNRESNKWVLTERQNYPADTGKLRQLLLALADAKKLEQKTSNPALYERLGVEDNGGTSGGEVRISGPDLAFSLIIGDQAQGKYRYVRIPGKPESWLIDQNPSLPGSASGWLLQEILDIDSSRIRSVTITHGDGETIRIEKENKEATGFDVRDIPDGRELSYAGVVNGIAGVLGKLNLQDVADASSAQVSDATTVFTTFDGLQITIDSWRRDEDSWISVTATQVEAGPQAEADEPDEAEPVDEGDDQADPEEATNINARLDGWVYQIQAYKGDQLRRRWDDILEAKE